MKLQELINVTDKTIYKDSINFKQRQSIQKELISFFGERININKINTITINNFVIMLEKKQNKASTINNKLAYLSSILSYARNNLLLEHKPYIKFKKNLNNRKRFLTEEEINSILNYSKVDKALYNIILIAINTGMRIENIIKLNPYEDIENGYIRVWNNKTNNPYSIPMTDILKDLYEDNIQNFICPYNYQQIYYKFRHIVNDLKLKNVSVHTLRHTVCSILIQKNISLPVVQALMGHKSFITTLGYSHLKNSNLEEAIKVL